ncbi:MAG: hypothetical protein FWC73_05825 [Defluviitaleaceae bacterium]|nr:hypothetical protein [Defluviitaleaceae bacterium]
MEAISVKCPGCGASASVNTGAHHIGQCKCPYCGILFLLTSPGADMHKREVKVTFNKVKTTHSSPADGDGGVHIRFRLILFICFVVVTAVMAFFAIRILIGSFDRPETEEYEYYPVSEVVIYE